MEAAQHGTTLPRVSSGDALAFLLYVELRRLVNIRDYARGSVMLEGALRRPHSKRRATDSGTWAFVFSLSEKQLLGFRDDVSNAPMRVCSRTDTVRSLLDAWRTTIGFMADETAVTTLGEDLENFTEIQYPKDTEA